jgi:hypothetical protein
VERRRLVESPQRVRVGAAVEETAHGGHVVSARRVAQEIRIDPGGRLVVGGEAGLASARGAEQIGDVIAPVAHRGTKRREAEVVRGVRIAARPDEALDDGETSPVHHGPVQMCPVVHPGNAEVRIGPMPKIEVYPGEILEVEHPGEAIGHAPRVKGRAGLEE